MQRTPKYLGAFETVRFLTAQIPAVGLSLLDVGCGFGEVARELTEKGFRVTAIDSWEDSVHTVRNLGIKAELADFLNYKSDTKYDVILFSRSMHHMAPLELVFSQIKTLLKSDGFLYLEEFGIERFNTTAGNWFYPAQELLEKLGLISMEEPLNWQLGEDAVQRWRDRHHHGEGIHSSKALLEHLNRNFSMISYADSPYLYRYWLEGLSKDESGYRLAKKLYTIEETLVNEGKIPAIGFRSCFRLKS